MNPGSTAASVAVADVANSLQSPAQAPPYPLHRTVWECTAVITGVGLITFVLPMGTPGYLALCVTASAVALAYGAYGIWRVPGTPRRWGLIGNPRRAEGIAYGFGWAALMTVLGAVPVAVARELVDRPPLS